MGDKSIRRNVTEAWMKLPDGSIEAIQKIEEFHGNERNGPPKYLNSKGKPLEQVARGIVKTPDGLDGTLIENPKLEKQ